MWVTRTDGNAELEKYEAHVVNINNDNNNNRVRVPSYRLSPSFLQGLCFSCVFPMVFALGYAKWSGQGVHQVDIAPVEFSIARRMSICQCHNMRKARKRKEGRKERKKVITKCTTGLGKRLSPELEKGYGISSQDGETITSQSWAKNNSMGYWFPHRDTGLFLLWIMLITKTTTIETWEWFVTVLWIHDN